MAKSPKSEERGHAHRDVDRDVNDHVGNETPAAADFERMEEQVERTRGEFACREVPGIKRAVDQEDNNGDEDAEQDFILTKGRGAIRQPDMIGSKSP